ncbi:hypothetical protein NL676_001239 [Syzygium grande]|nr:hypothetical protein NL676_001239 [Syzygium grande]
MLTKKQGLESDTRAPVHDWSSATRTTASSSPPAERAAGVSAWRRHRGVITAAIIHSRAQPPGPPPRARAK